MGLICRGRTLAAAALLVALTSPRGVQPAIPPGQDEGPPEGALVGQLLVARPLMLDRPGLGLDLPDASHLDYRDAPRFTQVLAGVLVQRGVLPPWRQ